MTAAGGRRLSRGERRSQLVALGIRLLETTPFHALSLDDVAERAGVSRSLMFHYFPTKLDYLTEVGLDRVHAHDQALVRHALDLLGQRPWVRVLGPGPDAVPDRVGCVSFVVDGVHPHDVGQVLDDSGIAVRTGHHCAWPLHRRLRVPASTRASFAVYTSPEEIDAFATALDRVPQVFGMSA